MTKNTQRIRTGLLALLLATSLQNCRGGPVQVNLIRNVEAALGQSPALNTMLTFHINGAGSCGGIVVDWGDGVTETTGTCADNSNASSIGEKLFQCDMTHRYSGWGGGKTVTAMTATNGSTTCEGRAMLRFNVPPTAPISIALARPGPMACDAVPGKPALANRTIVRIATSPINTRCGGIWYDNENPHCYDAEGIGAVAASGPPTFPFLGMRKFSLVMRVGTQVVQGGTNVQFTTNQSAPLELCVNEPNPSAGLGGYAVAISTDQLGPP